ncbi:MAG: NADH-ubiquinone oxidoreductase-F iron-sulfur binding region domain-containing protein [Acidimicrobiales bacterium]
MLANGVDWFRELGTEASPGSIICTVTGSTPFHGVAEFPIGTTVRQVIDELGGGARSGHRITAVLNGVSNPPLTPDQLDTPLTYEDMSAIGSGLGSVSLIVVDDATSLTSVAAGVARFLAVESCGQCEPCKRDGLDLAESLSDTSADGAGLGDERIDERLDTVARGARCALAGQTERVVGRLVELARRTETHPTSASEPYLVAPVVEMTGRQAVLDTAHATKRFDWTYPEDGEFSSAWPVQRLADQPVEIKAPRTAESTSPSTELGETINSSAADAGSFQSVTDLGRQINDEVGALRRVAPEEREQLLHELRRDSERYERAMEGVVFPALERLDPDEGPEITWYPAQHTKAAKQIVADLDLGSTPLSSRLVDQLCASITVSIDEVEEGVLPRLRRTGRRPARGRRHFHGVDQLIEP